MQCKISIIFAVTGLLMVFPASRTFCQKTTCASIIAGRGAWLLSQDRLREADSLFTAVDSGCIIDEYDLLKWMRIKGVLAEYGQAVRIACRIIHRQPQAAFIAQNQLLEIIKETQPDTIRLALEAYRLCALSIDQLDTPAFRQWLCGAYFRFGLFDEELAALKALDGKSHPATHEILECAFRRFSQKLYSNAIKPALLVYPRLAEGLEKSRCALMLYQSYAQCGNNDSAAQWLARAPLTNADVRGEAIVFYQQTGCLEKADSLIVSLPPSLTRDTLRIRQLLFSEKPQAASALCGQLSGRETAHSAGRNQLQLWRARALMFSGAAREAEALLDSIDFSPSMGGAHAVVSMKYFLNGIRKAPSAAQILGKLSYADWLHRPERAAVALASCLAENLPADVRQRLLEAGVATLIAGKQWSSARAIIEQAGFASASPELQYYCGVALVNLGEIEAGRKALEDLLLGRPADVFSEKARMFLLDAHLNMTTHKR